MGGYESLAVPSDANIRRATPWEADGLLARLSIGIEHVDDLTGDLDQAFARLRA